MFRSLFPIVLFFVSFIGFSQTNRSLSPYYTDSLKPDAYMLQVDHTCDSIRNFIQNNRSLIQLDTLRLAVTFTIRKADGTYIPQNPHSFEPIANTDTTWTLPATVISYQKEILMIELGAWLLNQDLFASNMYQSEQNDFYIPSHQFYIANNQLLFFSHGCSNPSAFIGSCGGTSSVYSNYFKDNEYYGTIIGGKTYYCGCGYNYIVSAETITAWIQQISALLESE